MPNAFQLRRVILPAGAPAGGSFVGALDKHSTDLAAVWSVARRLLSSHKGPLIRVRRSSDNEELDVYPLADGNLDVAALTTFCDGARDGHLVRVHDQLGLNDMIQEEPSEQPQILADGALVTMPGGAPCARFATSEQYLLSGLGAIDDAATLLACVDNISDAARFGGTDEVSQNHLFWQAGTWRAEARFVGASSGVEGANGGRVAFKQASSTTRFWQIDGGAEQDDNTGSLDTTFGVRGWFCTSHGAGAQAIGTGQISEMIIYSASLDESTVQAIQQTQEGLV